MSSLFYSIILISGEPPRKMRKSLTRSKGDASGEWLGKILKQQLYISKAWIPLSRTIQKRRWKLIDYVHKKDSSLNIRTAVFGTKDKGRRQRASEGEQRRKKREMLHEHM